MTDVKLGKLITTPQEKDAIHIACVPLIAGEALYKGYHFKLKYGTTDVAMSCYPEQSIGIVDPWLDFVVKKGEKFWGILNPGTVTGMRHEWKHPAFEPVEKGSESEEWLRSFADEWNFDFDHLISEAKRSGEDRYIVAMGRDLHSRTELDDEPLFWYHLEKYTGESFDEEHREKMEWSCSC